jgi:hypothetical protein
VDDIGRFVSYKQFSAYAGLVQVVLGMVRNPRTTGGYRLMGRYAAMKKEKGSGKAIIATARKLSKIVWYMLRNEEPFNPQRMTDPALRKIAEQMRAGLPAA